MEITKGDQLRDEINYIIKSHVLGAEDGEIVGASGNIVEIPIIKAAPRLYEALKEVRDKSVLQKQENGFYLLKLSYASWQEACKVISKAEGKQ